MTDIVLIDLFAGVGGFSKAFEEAGFNVSQPEPSLHQQGVVNKNDDLQSMQLSNCIDSSYHKGMDNHGQRTMVLCDSGPGRQIQERDTVAPLRSNTGAGHGNYIQVHSANKIRRLTEVECNRLQGFPDGWCEFGINEKGETIKISSTQQYKQMGNAISVPVAKAAALAIKQKLF